MPRKKEQRPHRPPPAHFAPQPESTEPAKAVSETPFLRHATSAVELLEKFKPTDEFNLAGIPFSWGVLYHDYGRQVVSTDRPKNDTWQLSFEDACAMGPYLFDGNNLLVTIIARAMPDNNIDHISGCLMDY